MEIAKIDLDQQVVNDINQIMGENYPLERYVEDVGNCFSTVDYDDPACQKCIVQAACSVYRGEKRLGMVGLRALTPPGSKAAPDEVKALLSAAINGAARISAALSPPSPPPSPAPPPPPTTMPPLPGVISTTLTPIQPPPPDPGLAIGILPTDGSPPIGWPNLDRDTLVQICRELGYTKEFTNFKKEKKLTSMILAKKPEWAPPVADVQQTIRIDPPTAGFTPSIIPPMATEAPITPGNGVVVMTNAVIEGDASRIGQWIAEHFPGKRVHVAVTVDR